MPVLKYWDPVSASYQVLTGPPGPTGIAYSVVAPTPPDQNNPVIAPPNGLMFIDTSVPDSTSGPFLPISGGTLTGTLVLAADPANPLESATKQYVDTAVGGGGSVYLPLAGGTLTGNLTISPASGDGVITLQSSTGWPTVNWQSTSINPYTYSAFVDANKTFYFRDVTRGNVNVYTIGSTGMLTLNGVFNPTVGIAGTGTNDNAVAGRVGEVISSVATATVALTTGVPINVTSITLTPGDWDVHAEIWFTTGTNVVQLWGGVSTVSATLPGTPTINQARFTMSSSAVMGATGQHIAMRTSRASISASTIYYLVAQASFSASTCNSTGGTLWARRAR